MKALITVCAMLGLVGLAAIGSAEPVDGWTTGSDPQGGFHASTVNDSGFILGQFCDSRTGPCYWLLGMSARCRLGAKYPVLVNSDTTALSLEVGCTGETAGQAGLYGLVFTDSEAMSSIVSRSTRLGIAFPLKGDQFRVVRFDVSGATAALAIARATSGATATPAPGDHD